MRKLFIHKSGIYQIRNLVNGNIYIGQSTDLATRRYTHFRLLSLNKSHSPHLQSAYNKYGKESFVFEVIMFCDTNVLDYFEQTLTDRLLPKYNSRKEVTSNRGHKVSEETKRKQSESNKGKHVISEETRNRLSLASTGRKFSDEVRKTLSERMMGRKINKGRIQPQEEKDRRAQSVREYWKTHKKVISDEARKKMSISRLLFLKNAVSLEEFVNG